ncbi:FecCD family ABC transporter permease [Ruania halotolerans]|uniref:FecCD family ABC transporter permease n=1 Tax=Ruania halotolerans TaxID=2897773 RepID=UPI001E2DD4D7|nr:iron ABC transporter permease [Ruania halotolerans]UFU08222.1 iron ABC transporter permease [Ruania halotolerans]
MTFPSAPSVPGSAPPRAATSILRTSTRRRILGGGGLALLVLLLVGASLAVGAREISLTVVWAALVDYVPGNVEHDVIIDQRLPRTVVGLAVGAALGAAGVLMQGLTRNPLADPGLLGVNAGAAFAVVLAITFLGVNSPVAFLPFAFLGAAGAAVLVYLVSAGSRDGATPVTLALAGTAVTAGVTSLIMLLLLSNPQTVNAYRFWSVGSLAGRDGTTQSSMLGSLLPFLIAGFVLAAVSTRWLNLLALGTDVARGLGVRVGTSRALSVVAVVLLAGSATALAGPIVFVGLVVPHAVRAATGPDHRWMFAYALPAGGALLLVADVLGRALVRPGELEAGLVVAAVGAPVMIAIVRRANLGGGRSGGVQ